MLARKNNAKLTPLGDLYDNRGHNSIVLGSGDGLEDASLTLDADGTGYVVGLAGGRSLNVQNGFMRRAQQDRYFAVNDAANTGMWKEAT